MVTLGMKKNIKNENFINFKIYKMLSYIAAIYTVAYYKTRKNRKLWDNFTRVMSTLNAFQCLYMVYYEIFCVKEKRILDLYYLASDYSLNSLHLFSYYLFVDGVFQLPDLINHFSFSMLLSVIHHFVGGLGIHLIAENKMGFFMGMYFAMTEISTPFLNLSWYFRYNFLFIIFYFFFVVSRIFTIPFLLEYLEMNTDKIMSLVPLQSFMSFYGSYSLIILNSIWFTFLTKKVLT